MMPMQAAMTILQKQKLTTLKSPKNPSSDGLQLRPGGFRDEGPINPSESSQCHA